MNTPRPLSALVLVIALASARIVAADAPAPAAPATAANAGAPKPPPLSPRFQQVRNRIDDLFKHRVATPAPVDPKHDPFRAPGPFVEAPVIGGEPRGAGSTRSAPAEPQGTDLTVLQQAVATLKVGGRFVSSGKEHRMVNARLYKEGDVIPTQLQNQTIYLRVKTLTQKSLTLQLNESEMTLSLQ
jgi:hypothetical protein